MSTADRQGQITRCEFPENPMRKDVRGASLRLDPMQEGRFFGAYHGVAFLNRECPLIVAGLF